MPYKCLEDVVTAHVAFLARADTLEELFTAAADATMNVMVENLYTIAYQEQRPIHAEADAADMVLSQLLRELICYKDADQLLLRTDSISIQDDSTHLKLEVGACDERPDPRRHELIVDVKAVTLHRFGVEQTGCGWQAMVVLDI